MTLETKIESLEKRIAELEKNQEQLAKEALEKIFEKLASRYK